MKPDWDKLGDEYADSSSVLIADVDCTAKEAEELCSKYEVRGYPTIKYFVDGDMDGQDYQGGRDFDSLKSHVENTLEVKCDVKDPSECSEKERGYIEKMKAKTAEEREKQLKRLEGMKDDPMKADLKKWLSQRLRILQAMAEAEPEL